MLVIDAEDTPLTDKELEARRRLFSRRRTLQGAGALLSTTVACSDDAVPSGEGSGEGSSGSSGAAPGSTGEPSGMDTTGGTTSGADGSSDGADSSGEQSTGEPEELTPEAISGWWEELTGEPAQVEMIADQESLIDQS